MLPSEGGVPPSNGCLPHGGSNINIPSGPWYILRSKQTSLKQGKNEVFSKTAGLVCGKKMARGIPPGEASPICHNLANLAHFGFDLNWPKLVQFGLFSHCSWGEIPLRGVLKEVHRRYMGGTWEVHGRYMGGTWEALGRH